MHQGQKKQWAVVKSMSRTFHITLSVILACLLPLAAKSDNNADMVPRGSLELRVGLEQLRDPFWYEANDQPAEAETFWNREGWEQHLKYWAENDYNAVLFWVEPWTSAHWKSLLIPNSAFPEARVLTPEQSARVIEQFTWIIQKGHKLGLQIYLFDYQSVTTAPFAEAHNLAKELPLSATVDYRHNLKQYMGPAYGLRTELTRAYSEEATAELFQTYPELDGLIGGMGEALPGRRSSWYREAIVPGLKRSGQNPRYVVMNWMMPMEEFLEDIAQEDLYHNTWTCVMAHGEMLTDTKPYPSAVQWAERSGMPTLFEVVHHNYGDGLPSNSPRLAWEIVDEFRKIPNCRGFLAWFLRYDRNDLFRKALGYYGLHDEPYCEERWVDILSERFGDRDAARHFLRAYDASARITMELSALAWTPMDRGVSQQLMLPYWYWTEQDSRMNYFTSPVRGNMLLPLRYYAKVIAQFGENYRDNSGADYHRNPQHPGAQELIWALGYYPITPEAHMRKIRRLGETSLREAEIALISVRKNEEEAQRIYQYMKAYKLLSDFYEAKVLAASAALIYGFAHDHQYRLEAEQLADEALKRYIVAISYIWEEIDKKSGNMKGRWGREFTLPELIDREKEERKQIGELFQWPEDKSGSQADPNSDDVELRGDRIGAGWAE